MTNFFQQPMIPSTQPAPEPPGFDLLRQMLMQKSFGLNSNPYGLNPSYQGGASDVYTNGQNQGFNPYGGGRPGGGGMGRRPMPPQQGGMGGGGMSQMGYPAQPMPGGGMQSGPGGGQGGGGFMQMLQQLMQQMRGGGARTMPMRPGGPTGGPDPLPGGGMRGSWEDPNYDKMQPGWGSAGPNQYGGNPGDAGHEQPDTYTQPGRPVATPPQQSPDLQAGGVPDRSRQGGFDGMTHYDGDGCTGASYDGDPYSGWQPGRYSTPQSIKPKDGSDTGGGTPDYIPPDQTTSAASQAAGGFTPSGIGQPNTKAPAPGLPPPPTPVGPPPDPPPGRFDGRHQLGNRMSAAPRMGGASGGMRQLAPLMDALRPSRGPSPSARIGKPLHGIEPGLGMLR